jgi:hypothetical protein
MRLSESYSNYVDHVMRCLNVMVGLKKPLRGLTSAETPRRAANLQIDTRVSLHQLIQQTHR